MDILHVYAYGRHKGDRMGNAPGGAAGGGGGMGDGSGMPPFGMPPAKKEEKVIQ
jgi:hypothetical protein